MLNEFSVVYLTLTINLENFRENARVSARFRISVKGGSHQRQSHSHREDETETHSREFMFPFVSVNAEQHIGDERREQQEKRKTSDRKARVNHTRKAYRKKFEFILLHKPYKTADYHGDINRNIEPNDICVRNVQIPAVSIQNSERYGEIIGNRFEVLPQKAKGGNTGARDL